MIQKDLLNIIIKNTNRLKSLTEDILEVTRIESNKLYLNKETVCIGEILHRIIKEFEHSIKTTTTITKILNSNYILTVLIQIKLLLSP